MVGTAALSERVLPLRPIPGGGTVMVAIRPGDIADRITRALQAAGHRTIPIQSWAEVLPTVVKLMPHVVMLDPFLPGASVESLAQVLPMRPRPRPAFVLVADLGPGDLQRLQDRLGIEATLRYREHGERVVGLVEQVMRRVDPSAARAPRPHLFGRILLADGDETARDRARAAMHFESTDFDEAGDWESVEVMTKGRKYRAIVYDVNLTGFRPLRSPFPAGSSLVLWTHKPHHELAAELRLWGAVYLSKFLPGTRLAGVVSGLGVVVPAGLRVR